MDLRQAPWGLEQMLLCSRVVGEKEEGSILFSTEFL